MVIFCFWTSKFEEPLFVNYCFFIKRFIRLKFLSHCWKSKHWFRTFSKICACSTSSIKLDSWSLWTETSCWFYWQNVRLNSLTLVSWTYSAWMVRLTNAGKHELCDTKFEYCWSCTLFMRHWNLATFLTWSMKENLFAKADSLYAFTSGHQTVSKFELEVSQNTTFLIKFSIFSLFSFLDFICTFWSLLTTLFCTTFSRCA